MSNSTLHILNRGPNQPDLLRHLLDAFSEGDEILLIEDGVYWGSDHFAMHFGQQRPKILAPDAQARGLELDGLIDDGEFVDLCVKHARSVSWG